jgi:hypothetical protein
MVLEKSFRKVGNVLVCEKSLLACEMCNATIFVVLSTFVQLFEWRLALVEMLSTVLNFLWQQLSNECQLGRKPKERTREIIFKLPYVRVTTEANLTKIDDVEKYKT